MNILEGALLSDFTTFRLGGPCQTLFDCQTPQQLETVVQKLVAGSESLRPRILSEAPRRSRGAKSKDHEKANFILIGGGSNLVVSDEGLPINVIRYLSPKPLIERQGNDLIISGSTLLDDAVGFALENSLEGLNYASGIPGTVGGAIVGNAGAFGKQVGDYLKSVCLLTKSGIKKDVSAAQLGFSYRHSNLKETGDMIVWARFGLTSGDQSKLRQERNEILQIRHEKHPNLETHPCAGSFFRNIEPTSKAERRQAAGFFLEQAGVKSFRVGGAGIFDKHANIIVKSNGCRSQDVYDLHLLMAKAVKEKFGIDLVREVRFVGEFEGRPSGTKEVIW